MSDSTKGHTPNCGTAKGRGCQSPCLNTQHGLAGRLEWVVALSTPTPNDQASSEHRAEAKKRQASATEELKKRIAVNTKRESSRTLSGANWLSALEFARTADMVKWLVDNPTERQQLESIVKQLVVTSSKLLESVPASERGRMKLRILDHLWCDLIASIVRAIEAISSFEGKVKEAIAKEIAEAATDLLISVRKSATALPETKNSDGALLTRNELDAEANLSMESAIIQGCIRAIVGHAIDAAAQCLDSYLKMMLLNLRIGGVMLCPDIVSHDNVWKHCWLRLWEAVLLDELMHELGALVPGLKEELPGGGAGEAQTTSSSSDAQLA